MSILENNGRCQGRLVWIGLRPARRAPLLTAAEARVDPSSGLEGDHFAGRYNRQRQITLIQAEHLSVISALLEQPVEAAQLRRNLLIAGINLLALKGQLVSIGDVLLRISGHCHPCSRMEASLGPGGYDAMRGHGGVTAEVLRGGILRVGDRVTRAQQDLFAEVEGDSVGAEDRE
ncbi:MOSC domain-containing protein [Methyloterricola oryzae]|uniref:MOSC domain-containing protein n=1 Tax=Methyloterricola oryzae TaxID=1495050 RepID=UPI001F16158B|nr:MOSC domain-containing protein [Methyloterricola oryzae]